MATLGGVYMHDTDGNIGVETSGFSEGVCGLIFDISGQSNFWTSEAGQKAAAAFQDKVVELHSVDEAVKAGIEAFDEITPATATNYLLGGVAYYHIKRFFDIVSAPTDGGTERREGRLFVMFADCKTNWDALIEMQNAARGYISQVGVWTEQSLWKQVSGDAEEYGVNLVTELNAVALTLAEDYQAPLSILLNANVACVASGDSTLKTVTFSKIPNLLSTNRFVSVVLGQEASDTVAAMQSKLASLAPVGNIGVALGCVAEARVSESIGWVAKFNLADYFGDIEFGFGDVTALSDGSLTSTTNYAALKRSQIEELDAKGYIFLCRYAGESGVFFSSDTTCSNGDYRTIARNRAMNKSRRLVRAALLPYVNSPIKVDPANGNLSASQIAVFHNLVSDVLTLMVNNEELSGVGQISIPANQNILKNDKLNIRYSCIPMGTSKRIDVYESYTISQA